MRIKSWAAAAALASCAMANAHAATGAFTFDPDGSGPISPITMDVFDWAPGSSLILGAVPLDSAGKAVTQYGHAKLANLQYLGSNVSVAAPGEFTVVFGFGEVGTGSVSNVASFTYDPSNATNFFRVYYDPANNASDLAGTGFDDGILIMSGTISAANGNYLNFAVAPQPFDSFLTNDYPGITSRVGTGGQSLEMNVGFASPAFFPVEQPATLLLNQSQITPFNQVNPSRQFAGLVPGNVITPAIGTVNGTSGPDFQLQVDANMAVTLAPPSNPAITIKKLTGALPGAANGVDADDPNAGDAPQIAIGNAVYWTYRVTNTGNVTLNNVVVTDDQGVAVTCPATTLAPGASMDCTASGVSENLLTTGNTTEPGVCGGISNTPLYKNIGTVVGSPANGQPNVTANDPSHYCNPQQPLIDIVKVTGMTAGFANGVDANDPNAGDAPQIAIGNAVYWTYRVTNTGNVTLNNVVVTDDQGVAVTCPATTLAPGASMDCTASGVSENLLTTGNTTEPGVCGGISNTPLYKNIGTVVGSPANGQPNVTANDPSHYCNPQRPSITIVKVTGSMAGFANGVDANDPNAGDAPQIAIGNAVYWTYRVTNTGNVSLSNVVVTDDQGVAVTCPATTLTPGATMDCTASDTAVDLTSTTFTTVPGVCGNVSQKPLYRNKGMVSALPPVGGAVTAEDPSHYCNITQKPEIDLIKYVSVDGKKTWEDANFPTGPVATICNTTTSYSTTTSCVKSVYFKFVITNTGDVTLTNLVLTDVTANADDKVDVSTCVLPSSLAVGAIYTCIVGPVTARTGQHTDTGKVTAKGGTTTVFDKDDANYYGKSDKVVGTGTPGYWKNHPEAWPVSTITIGGVSYTKTQAINWLNTPDRGDKTVTMFRHLVSAKLNVLNGADSSCIASTISAADAWMQTHGPVGSGVAASSAAWQQGSPLATKLDNYNNGLLCAPHRD